VLVWSRCGLGIVAELGNTRVRGRLGTEWARSQSLRCYGAVTCTLIALYVIAGALEAIGLALVAYDFYESTKSATEIKRRPIEYYAPSSRMRSASREPTLKELEHDVNKARSNLKHELKQIRDDLAEILAGHRWRRIGGLTALAFGLVVGVAANIWSAVR
jgi:hypothetical protein